MPLQNIYLGVKLQLDDMIVPQGDLFNISCKEDFDYDLFETREDTWLDTATRLLNDAASGGVDDYATEDERSTAHEDERSSEKNESDVTENGTRPRPATSRDAASPLKEPTSTGENENDVTNELNDEEISSKKDADQILPCPEYWKMLRKSRAPEEGNIIFDLTPPSTILMNRY